jgi:hypothetical protein
MNYPKAIKAFYMRLNDDSRTVAAMDVLAPRIGEIIGGSQREERLEVLDRSMAERGIDREHYARYRDLRRYGTVPHAGFGLGFERTLAYVTGRANVRDAIPSRAPPATRVIETPPTSPSSTSPANHHQREPGSRSGGAQRLRTLDPLALPGTVHRLPQIAAPLHVQPEVGAVAEYPREDQCGRRRHGPAIIAQLVDVLPLDAHRLGKRGLRQPHRLHELLDKDFTNRGRFALGRQHGSPHR